MLEDIIFEDEILEVEPKQDWLVAESPSMDCISIIRKDADSYVFIRNFMMKYETIKEPLKSDSLKMGSIDKALPFYI